MALPATTWTRQPRQARSQRTLDALLDAAETLLAERPFHDIAITEIIGRAGSSAGAFYARFPDKEALLHALHERLAVRGNAIGDFLRQAAPRLADTASPAGDARAVARLVIGNLVRGHRRNRGVLRAVAIAAFRDARFATRAQATMSVLREASCEVLRPYRGARSADVFDDEVSFALRLVLAALDQQLFVPPGALDARADAALGVRLADAFIRQLQLE